MLSVQSLQKVASGLRSTLGDIRRVNESLNRKIEQLTSDKSRSQSYITQTIKEMREEVLPKARADLQSMHAIVETAEAQREFWDSGALVLSLIPFHDDLAVDALMRMRYQAELAAMDHPLLALTQKNALADGKLALVWACAMAGRISGAGDLADLSVVEIPQRQQALDLIADCDAALSEAELIVAGMSGQTIDPVRKLTHARRMQPNRPTTHNSPGRPPTP